MFVEQTLREYLSGELALVNKISRARENFKRNKRSPRANAEYLKAQKAIHPYLLKAKKEIAAKMNSLEIENIKKYGFTVAAEAQSEEQRILMDQLKFFERYIVIYFWN